MSLVWSTRRRRPMWCRNLYVTFCKRVTNYRALLRKMTYKNKASYGSSPPCANEPSFEWLWHVLSVCDTHPWVMSNMWIRHVTHMNVSCHTYAWVRSHMWRRHVMQMHESCDTLKGVMPHRWISHVTHVHESCHPYEWVMSHTWRSHVTHEHESCHT